MDMPPEVRIGLISAGVVITIAVLLLVFGDRPELAAAIRRRISGRASDDMSSEDEQPAAPAAGTKPVHVPVLDTGSRSGTTPSTAGGTEVTPPDTDAREGGTEGWNTPRLSLRLSDAETIALLAAQRGADGKHRYSANQIHALIGGSRAAVLDQVRVLRADAPPVFPPLSEEQQQLRAQLQLDQVKR